MKPRKTYRIEMSRGGRWVRVPWIEDVSREFTRGFLAAGASFYPSHTVRVVDTETGEVVEAQVGNGAVRFAHGGGSR